MLLWWNDPHVFFKRHIERFKATKVNQFENPKFETRNPKGFQKNN